MELTILLSLGSLCVYTALMKVDFARLLLPRMRSILCMFFSIAFLENQREIDANGQDQPMGGRY